MTIKNPLVEKNIVKFIENKVSKFNESQLSKIIQDRPETLISFNNFIICLLDEYDKIEPSFLPSDNAWEDPEFIKTWDEQFRDDYISITNYIITNIIYDKVMDEILQSEMRAAQYYSNICWDVSDQD